MARKLTTRAVQKRYNEVADRTIDRWVKAGIFPQPMRINKIRYWDEDEVEQYDRERMAAQRAGSARLSRPNPDPTKGGGD
jgi:predicted DNA-binding transcriptional regulator AlpA